MKPENNNEKTTEARKKRNKDQFLIVLMGLVGYGFILIAIVIGTFFAVKNAFAKKDAEVRIKRPPSAPLRASEAAFSPRRAIFEKIY